MAKDLNKVMFTGYLGAEPEMKYTPQGSAVVNFRVGSGRSWKSADGEQHDETEWFKVVAWDKLAEICNQYLTTGTRVYIEGRLQTRKYQDAKSGEDRYITEVIANDMIILSSKQEGGGKPAPERGTSTPANRGAAPNRNPPAQRPPARNVPQAIENEDDLPF